MPRIKEIAASTNGGAAGEGEEDGTEEQEKEDDRVDLEWKIKTRMNQTTAQPQPRQ